MNIVKIHYTQSLPVSNWLTIQSEAEEMAQLVRRDKDNMYALHHSQVSTTPFNFFVLEDSKLEDHVLDLGSKFIINPRIVSSLEGSTMPVYEGCVSFPYRKQKKVERAMIITVEYDIPDPLQPNGLAHKQKQVERIVAQIFQHECGEESGHSCGKNIYFDRPKEGRKQN